ncbi:hypothetical protein ACFLXD_01260 [Chloroflexota bacterium]
MWKRFLWQYSQWKLLYIPLSPLLQWLLRGILEEWLFSYLAEYVETRAGVVVDIINWIVVNPTLSTIIVVGFIAVIIALWAVSDARKKIQGIYDIENVLLKMYNLALNLAREKAKDIKLDAKWITTMKNVSNDIVGINSTKYKGKNTKDRKIIAKIEKDVKKVTPTDEDAVTILKLIASTMVNNGYGITEELQRNKKNKKLKRTLEVLRKVPSNDINNMINKYLEYIYILSHIYIFQLARMRNTAGMSEATLAEYRNSILDQENNTGDMSKCLTSLRIEIYNFVRGDRYDKEHQL